MIRADSAERPERPLELVRGLHNLREDHRGCAVTIGNFDGVHLGHRAVLDQLGEVAGDAPATLVTFEPHPREFLRPGDAPSRLTGLAEKLTLLGKAGLARVLLVRFDRAFAGLGPEDFINTVLVRGLGARVVVIGDDFRFGRGGAGDFAALEAAGALHGFLVHRRATVESDGERVSSSRIRACLANGELEIARHLLGRPYCIQGRVAHGRQLGRTIGFPTANVRFGTARAPVSGVFAVRVHRDGAMLPGVANVGRRPTVDGEDVQLEVHLFDFQDSLYGERIRVELVERLREERKFESLDALKAQIAQDAAAARTRLGVGC